MHPALALLPICMGAKKMNAFVFLLFYPYPGKGLLPDSEKSVKGSLKIKSYMPYYFIEKEKKPVSRIHDALAI